MHSSTEAAQSYMGNRSVKGDFKKGDTRINRTGLNRMSPEQKALRDAYPQELIRILKEAQCLTTKQLEDYSLNQNLPILYQGVIQCIKKFYNTGDFQKYMEPLISRIIGKPKEFLDVTALPKPVIIERISGSQEILAYEDQKKLTYTEDENEKIESNSGSGV